MDIEIFTLCHYAEATSIGLTIINAFDTIFISNLPDQQSSFTVTARIRYSSYEQGKTAIHLRLSTPDGENIIPPFSGDINLSYSPGAESMSYNFVVNLQGLTFKTYGKHSITLSIRGQELRKLPLYIVQPSQSKSEVPK